MPTNFSYDTFKVIGIDLIENIALSNKVNCILKKEYEERSNLKIPNFISSQAQFDNYDIKYRDIQDGISASEKKLSEIREQIIILERKLYNLIPFPGTWFTLVYKGDVYGISFDCEGDVYVKNISKGELTIDSGVITNILNLHNIIG